MQIKTMHLYEEDYIVMLALMHAIHALHTCIKICDPGAQNQS